MSLTERQRDVPNITTNQRFVLSLLLKAGNWRRLEHSGWAICAGPLVRLGLVDREKIGESFRGERTFYRTFYCITDEGRKFCESNNIKPAKHA